MSIYHSPTIVTNGLFLSLDAANKRSYSGSGTSWLDASGNNNNSSISSAPTFDSQNKGAIFINSQDVVVPHTSTISSFFATGSFTIETIVKSTDSTYPLSRHPFFVNQNPTASNIPGWSVGHGISSSSIEVRSCDGTNLNSTFINHNVVESTIYHRVFVVSRSPALTTNYYVNGQYVGQAVASSVTGSIYGSGGFAFGNVWGWRYKGFLYIIRIYNRALNQNEISTNFNATRLRFGL